MNTVALQQEYQYVDSTRLIGAAPTIHIDNSVYTRVELMLDRFISERTNIDYLRNFECVVLMQGAKELVVKIDSMIVYWKRVTAEDGEWFEPTEIIPMWHESSLYNEEGERLPHDFDINVVIKRLTFH